MTARLPEGPVRVTSWLAGWVDYVFAIVLVAGRCLRLPASRDVREPVMMSAFAPAMGEAYAPRWHDSESRPQGSGKLIKTAEIVMLSISFFLAAHLLSGGTPTVTAPNLNPLGLLPEHARAQSLPIPAAPTVEINVPAGSFVVQDAEPAAAPTEELAVLAPASSPGTDAASIAPPPTAVPAPAAATPAPEPPAPAAVATQAPQPEVPARYLTPDEFRAAALTAGWPAALLPELEDVAWCESRFYTHAENLGALGLMQMLPNWFPDSGHDRELWWDPVTNLRAAWYAYDWHHRNMDNGWGPWTCKPLGR